MACIARSTAYLNVGRGEIVTILGANGAGKTSLLKAIAGVVRTLPGKQVASAAAIFLPRPHEIVESGLALVPEGRGIFGDLTVKENLLLGANPKRARAGEAARREQVLGLFPRLRERAAQIARTMSGGEQQMLAIGRALMSNPDILLLDEPSLGLACHGAGVVPYAAAVREAGVGSCSSSRTPGACGSPTAAMCSKTASSSGTAPPII
jgi:branched-chain amino acid transport system ATP-binding protein